MVRHLLFHLSSKVALTGHHLLLPQTEALVIRRDQEDTCRIRLHYVSRRMDRRSLLEMARYMILIRTVRHHHQAWGCPGWVWAWALEYRLWVQEAHLVHQGDRQGSLFRLREGQAQVLEWDLGWCPVWDRRWDLPWGQDRIGCKPHPLAHHSHHGILVSWAHSRRQVANHLLVCRQVRWDLRSTGCLQWDQDRYNLRGLHLLDHLDLMDLPVPRRWLCIQEALFRMRTIRLPRHRQPPDPRRRRSPPECAAKYF